MHKLALDGAKEVGCQIVNIGPEDLYKGEQSPTLILGVVWQLIRVSRR